MGRTKQPCEFCNGEYESTYKEHNNGYCIWIEVYPDNQNLSFIAQANGEDEYMIEDSIDVQMNYCPVCGRKLI